MRITQRMISQSALRGVLDNLESLHRAQAETTSGVRLNRISDDPVSSSIVLQLDSRLRGLEGYQRAGRVAETRLAAEDAVLTSVGDLIREAQTAAGRDYSPELRQSAVDLVNNIRNQVISMGNTQVAGEYIFAGTQSTQPAFLADGTYQGNSTAPTIEIGDGLTVVANHTGAPLLSNVINALDQLAQDLATGTPEDIETALGVLNQTGNVVRNAHGEVGSRMRHVESMRDFFVNQSQVVLDQKDDILSVDPTESVLKLQQAQATLERAYAAISRVLETNILDFLR